MALEADGTDDSAVVTAERDDSATALARNGAKEDAVQVPENPLMNKHTADGGPEVRYHVHLQAVTGHG